MKRATIFTVFALMLASCAATHIVDLATTPVSTPQQAQKVLAEAQAARVAVRNSIAKAYVSAQQNLAANPNDPAAVRLMTQANYARFTFSSFDEAFTKAWQIAADAVDAWLRTPNDPNGATTFQTIFASVTSSLNNLKTAGALAGGAAQ